MGNMCPLFNILFAYIELTLFTTTHINRTSQPYNLYSSIELAQINLNNK